ncbi:hypothetical protein NDN08_007333 [Rhodosorus marinus]|uniref:Mitochondrial import inner membrane translocase subunit TIM50 n=1 Tax=Rhodosorus marinus TaxID=101924 RepID=A0AAV8UG70_9RHOD|nr:hypothetical protein NDN08_007333 [Rhodosorus marinus]
MSGASLAIELEIADADTSSGQSDEANEDYQGAEVSLRDMVSARGIWGRLEESIMSCMHGEVVDRSSLCAVLDLNGLLLFRETRKDRVIGKPPPFDFRMKTGRAWLRPNSSVFLLYAFRRFRVGFWSSAMSQNVKIMLQHLLHPFQKPIFVLNRRDTLPDSAPGAKPHATLKDLTLLWESVPYMSDKNTVIVDDTPSKTRLQELNRVIVPEYTGREVGSGSDDDVLIWVIMYLEFCALGISVDGSIQSPIGYLDFADFVKLGRSEDKAVALFNRISDFDANEEVARISSTTEKEKVADDLPPQTSASLQERDTH